MTNEITLTPQEEKQETVPSQAPKLIASNKELPATDVTEKKLPDPKKEIPVSHWIMPPEQHGYIQAYEKDCL